RYVDGLRNRRETARRWARRRLALREQALRRLIFGDHVPTPSRLISWTRRRLAPTPSNNLARVVSGERVLAGYDAGWRAADVDRTDLANGRNADRADPATERPDTHESRRVRIHPARSLAQAEDVAG